MSNVSLLSGISGLSFDITLPSSLLLFYLLLLHFLSCPFFPLMEHSPDFFSRKISEHFLLRNFLVAWLLVSSWEKIVSRWHVQHPVIFFIVSIHFFLYPPPHARDFFLNAGTDKSDGRVDDTRVP